jgi:hypothetical protein
MKIRLLFALAGLAITFTAPVFAQQKDTVDPQIAEQVRALAQYDEAFNKNDATALGGGQKGSVNKSWQIAGGWVN